MNRLLVDRVISPDQTLSVMQTAMLAVSCEAGPWDGLWVSEARHDPFLTMGFAAEHTERLSIGTSIAVALSRSPMTMAYTAYDLQRISKGRFILGIGSQVKAHIERRFSMPWSAPTERMCEYIAALRCIWNSWRTGERLHFQGDFYQHTLMPGFFSPPALEHPDPPIYLAAVGPTMTALAGEVADGVILHGFTTATYIAEQTLPALQRGLDQSGRSRGDVAISTMAFVVTGRTESEFAHAAQAVREQIAFYGSTPAYRPVMDAHGWGEAAEELSRMMRQGGHTSADLSAVITDDMLHAFAVVAEPHAVAGQIHERFAGLVDRLSFYTPYQTDDHLWTDIAEDLLTLQSEKAQSDYSSGL